MQRSSTVPFGQPNAAKPEECPICLEGLCTNQVSGFMTENSRRACRHFVHWDCAQLLTARNKMECPMCRNRFKFVVRMPDPVTETVNWFGFIDVNGDGRLSKDEVVWALAALFDAEKEDIEHGIGSFWRAWDKDGNDTLELNELNFGRYSTMPQLLDVIKGHRRPRSEIPLFESGEHWYYYWDENRSRSLDFEEVYRAVCLTFNIRPFAGEGEISCQDLRSILLAIWFDFDPDGSGTIDPREFSQSGGLWDFIQANVGTQPRNRQTGGAPQVNAPAPSDPQANPCAHQSYSPLSLIGIPCLSSQSPSHQQQSQGNYHIPLTHFIPQHPSMPPTQQPHSFALNSPQSTQSFQRAPSSEIGPSFMSSPLSTLAPAPPLTYSTHSSQRPPHSQPYTQVGNPSAPPYNPNQSPYPDIQTRRQGTL
eukprot:GHVN01030829.1.p1 GENE.GHVN01030829.1~~GHVN01030829.1.p1  ORF type:complete len:421 (+),score=69.23 GHVN01030829.1:753-2015(+)